MKKYKKLIIVFFIVIIIIVLLSIIIKPNIEKRITSYLLKQGYTNNSDLYEKQISTLSKEEYDYYVSLKVPVTYSKESFSIATFRLTRNIEDYQDSVTSSLTETFDYRDNSLIFTYRISYDAVNAIFKGEYDRETEEFICEKEFAYGVFANNFQTTTCSLVKQQVEQFATDSLLLFPNYEFIEYMASQEKE